MSVLKADCRACGTVFLTLDELSCVIQRERKEALCQFACPIYTLTVTQELPPQDVAILRAMGARELMGSVPFELLEDHFGPPLSFDDLLDFHDAILDQPGTALVPEDEESEQR